MSNQEYILAYCSDNEGTAQKIEQDLGKAGIRFKHLTCDSTNSNSFSKAISKTTETIFLLISDNFLKSSICMHDGLNMLNTGLSNQKVQPIIVDGIQFNKNISSLQSYPTEFSRISDLIKYMNYWQEDYLRMRKNKANISEKQEQDYNKELKRVRTISAEIGEFLRVLRETNYWTMNDMEEGHYELFFNRIGKQDLLVQYQNAFEGKEIPDAELNAEMDSPVDSNPVHDISSQPSEIPPAPPTPEEGKELTELEKKNQATYDIIADIFEDDDDELVEDEVDDEKVDFTKIENTDSWEDVNSENPSDVDAFFTKIAHLIQNDEDHVALKQLDIFLTQHPENAQAYAWMARIASNDEDYALAKGYLEKSVDLDDKNAATQAELGQLIFHHFKDQYKQAEKAFKKAIALDETMVEAHYYYALLLTELLNKPKKAIKYFENTLALDPMHPFANYDLAFLYYNKKKKTKAARHYEHAFTINPELRVPENDKAFWYDEYLDSKTKGAEEVEADEVEELELPDIKVDNEATEEMIKPEEGTASGKVADKPTVLITGATSGIGKATAELFAANGYRIIMTGRRQDRLENMKAHFEESHNSDIHLMTFDVRDFESSKAQIDALPEEWQQIDLLINNAGLAKGYAPVHEGDLCHWETMIDTNVKGLLYMTRLVTPGMVERKAGQIINVCSSAGHEVYPNGNVYCATKHAVDALTKGLRLELHKYGIRVGQVSPGHVEETEFAAVRFDGDLERAAIYDDFQPLKSSDVAAAIYFMASQPPHVTVQDLILMGTQQASNVFIDRSGR